MKRRYLCGVMVGISCLVIHGEIAEEVPIIPSLASLEKVKDLSPIQRQREISFAGKDAFDIEKKRQDVLNLVEKGIKFLEKHTIVELMWRINFTTEFDYGELSLFVDDFKGTQLANRTVSSIWQNFFDQHDAFGTYFVKKTIDQAQHGGGWVTYEWEGSTKVSYVKMIQRDGKKYVIGCGFYPHSKEESVVTLVRGAASTFYSYVDRGASVEDAFADFSFPNGKFIIGDLYVFVLDKDLVIRSNGRDPGEVGVSYWEFKDAKGEYLLRKIPATLSTVPPSQGRWFDYDFYNAPMRTYVERVIDKEGNSYFIACGYHPYADREMAVSLVKRGQEAVKKQGLKPTAVTINDWSNREFVYGRMALFIYETDGMVVADGARPTIAGKNMMQEKDDSGFPYVKDIIGRVSKEPSSWISFRLKKTVCSVYCESLVFEGKKYVVGTSFYPISKESSMVLLVKSAQGLLESTTDAKAFRAFGESSGNYMLGDLAVFVYGLDGTCYADGREAANVLSNMLNEKDDEGRPYVKIMINAGRTEPAKVVFRKNGARMVAYVEPVKKGNKLYIVGSGYCV